MVRIGHLVISEPVCGFKAVLEATVTGSSWFCRREKRTYAVRFWVRIKAPEGIESTLGSTYMEFFETIQCSSYDEADEILEDIEKSLSKRLYKSSDAQTMDAETSAETEVPVAETSDAETSDDEYADMPDLISPKPIACVCGGPENKPCGGTCDGPCGGPCAEESKRVSTNNISSLPQAPIADVPDEQACCFSAM